MEGRISTISIGQREQAHGGVMENVGENDFYLVFLFGRGGEWVWERSNSCYMWKNVTHEKKKVQTKKHGKKLCVTNSCNGVHEMISMNKPLDSLLK